MANRNHARLGLFLLCAFAVICLLKGLVAGAHRDWMRMSLYLAGFLFEAFVITSVIVILVVDRCFRRIIHRIDDSYVVCNKPCCGAVKVAGLVMVISVTVLFSLCWWYGLREDTFALGTCLTACAVVAFVSMSLMMALAIQARFERMADFAFGVRKENEDREEPREASQGQPSE